MKLDVPAPYHARSYRGPVDHAAMAEILGAYRLHGGDPEKPTVAQMDVTYANLTNCDPAADIAIVETDDGGPVAYARTTWSDTADGRDCVVFAPTLPVHLAEPLFAALVRGQEAHLRSSIVDVTDARFLATAPHPGPGRAPRGESAWLESFGYSAAHWGASLVRPHLDEIPDRTLPDGVEVRPVTADMLRVIWEAHQEAFRHEWGFSEPTDEDFTSFVDDPLRDESLWKIAWCGDVVVGQVKSYINSEENVEHRRLRGYTEEISVHADWRNGGIAGALLSMSLRELSARGMTEAALGVDTDNHGGALHLYTSLGFVLQSYQAVYEKAVGSQHVDGRAGR